MVEQYEWDYSDFSHDALVKRAKYLTEVIDLIPGKATYEDVERLPDGRVVVTWGPASGKSTAIRQYLCRNQMKYIIYATARKSDVDAMYYDLIAMKEVGIIVRECKIAKFHTDYDPGESVLKNCNILICTHERLMIEPPSILYRLEGDVPNHLGQVIREEMLIDELPKFYKSFRVSENLMMSLGYVNDTVSRFKYDRRQRLAYRYSKFRTMIDDYLNGRQDSMSSGDLGAVMSLIDIYKKMNIMILNTDKDRAIRKFAYFSDMLAEKLLESIAEYGLGSIIDSNLYYSLLDIDVPNIKIFDGTGDLIMRGSSCWQISRSPDYNRRIKLRSPIETLSGTSMIRAVNNVEDLEYTKDRIDKLVSHIKNLLKTNPGKILVYTWKSIRLQYDFYLAEKAKETPGIHDLPNYIRSLLTAEENSRVEITHYMSGKERVTSEFSDCDSIIIAGKFFIPNSAISKYNEVNDTSIISADYTKSLIIQAIYRTSARHDCHINVYFTDDYDHDMIQSIMSRFDEILIGDENCTGSFILPSIIHRTSRNQKYYNFLKPYFNEIWNNGTVRLSVPESEKYGSTSTKDFKIAIQNLLKDTPLTYFNIHNSDSFRIILPWDDSRLIIQGVK